MSFVVALSQAVACLGMGAALLRTLALLERLSPLERLSWSFALGFGALGWILFFFGVAGLFGTFWLSSLLILGAAGCLYLWPFWPMRSAQSPIAAEYSVLCLLAIVLTLDFVEALAPAADGDTLAYHFALPKQFVAIGALEFVPRALDGAIPLLVHMTYVPALALGGERALTLWMLVTSWAAYGLCYTIARRYLARSWSLCVMLLVATTPALIYGSGSGQVEPRLMLFAVLAAAAIAELIRTDDLRYSVLAGLAIGFFVGGKYTGPLFALACGLTVVGAKLVNFRLMVREAGVLTIVVIVIGCQWYIWNWVQSGDPIFPKLFGLLPYTDPTFWDAAHHVQLQEYVETGERAVPVNFWWLLAYPFVASFSGPTIFESGRTGVGPFAILVFPIAMLAAWTYRARVLKSPLLALGSIAVLFYVVWFISGFSQRIRHLVPAYPLVVIVLTAAAVEWSKRNHWKPMLAAVMLSAAVQLGAALIFARGYITHVVERETRDDFLRRNVSGYDAARWVNAHLGPGDKIYTLWRPLIFLFDVPSYYGHTIQDARVDARVDGVDPAKLMAQFRRQGITHVLAYTADLMTNGLPAWRTLVAADCLRLVSAIDVSLFGSRTMRTLAESRAIWGVYALEDARCPLPGGHLDQIPVGSPS